MTKAKGKYESFGVCLNSKKDECYYCLIKLDDKNRSRDHLIPRSQNGILAKANKVWCCQVCNGLKENLDPYKFKEKLERILLVFDESENRYPREYYELILQSVTKMILIKETQVISYKYKLIAYSIKEKIAYIQKANGVIYCLRPPYPIEKEKSSREVVANVIINNGYIAADTQFVNSSDVVRFLESENENNLSITLK